MDIRIINTKNRIQGGLVKVLLEKPLYKVKDKDIIHEAQVSAASYYKYYTDKSIVLKDLESDLISDFKKALYTDSKNIFEYLHGPTKKDISREIDTHNKVMNFFTENEEVIKLLVSANGDPAVKIKLTALTASMVKKLIYRYFEIYGQASRLKGKDLKINIISERYADSFLNPFFIWLKNVDQMSVADVRLLMKNMILKSPYDLSTHDLNE